MKKNIFIFTSSFLSLTVLEYFLNNKLFSLEGVCLQRDFLKTKNNFKQRLKNYLGRINFNFKDNFYNFDPYAYEKKKILKYKKILRTFYWEKNEKEALRNFLTINNIDIILVAGFKYINESTK